MDITTHVNYQFSEIEIVYKSLVSPESRPAVTKSGDAYHVLLSCWDDNAIELQEESKVMFMSNSRRVIGVCHLSKGTRSSTLIDIPLVFASALKANASSIILAHNHPSGNLVPSKADKTLTQQAIETGKIIGITVDDHLIITRQGYFSMTDDCSYWRTEAGLICRPG